MFCQNKCVRMKLKVIFSLTYPESDVPHHSTPSKAQHIHYVKFVFCSVPNCSITSHVILTSCDIFQRFKNYFCGEKWDTNISASYIKCQVASFFFNRTSVSSTTATNERVGHFLTGMLGSVTKWTITSLEKTTDGEGLYLADRKGGVKDGQRQTNVWRSGSAQDNFHSAILG